MAICDNISMRGNCKVYFTLIVLFIFFFGNYRIYIHLLMGNDFKFIWEKKKSHEYVFNPYLLNVTTIEYVFDLSF